MSLGVALVLLLRFYVCPYPQLFSAPTPAFPSINLHQWLLCVTFCLKRVCTKSLSHSSQAQFLGLSPGPAGGWTCGSARSGEERASPPCLSSFLLKGVGDGHPRLTQGRPSAVDRQVKHVAAQHSYLASRVEIPLQTQLPHACLFCLHSKGAGGRLLVFRRNSLLLIPQMMELHSTTKDQILPHLQFSGNLWEHAFYTLQTQVRIHF